MDSKPLNKFFLVLFISVFIFSCSDSKPQVCGLYPKIICDTEADEVRLSFFAQVTSEPEKIRLLRITHTESSLYWETDNVTLLQSPDGRYQYAGCSSFMPVYDQPFPEGNYSVYFEDYTGKEFTSSFYLHNTTPENYDSMKKDTDIIAVFNRNNSILYAGEQTSDILTQGGLLNKYPEAFYVRKIALSNDGTIVYLLEKNILAE